MWGRLSNVASGVAGLVTAPVEGDELAETRELLTHTQEELRAALHTIEERDREIQNLSRASQVSGCLFVCLCVCCPVLAAIFNKPGKEEPARCEPSLFSPVTRLPSKDPVGS